MLCSKFKSYNCDFSKFWCGLGEEFSTLSKRAFELIIPFQDTYLCEVGFSSKSIKRNSDLDWFPKMTWEYHFQPLFPKYQILCAENKHKSITEWLAGWNCSSFFNRRKVKHGWLYIPSSQRFAPWLSDMAVRMILFLEFQQPQQTTSWKYSCLLARAFY